MSVCYRCLIPTLHSFIPWWDSWAKSKRISMFCFLFLSIVSTLCLRCSYALMYFLLFFLKFCLNIVISRTLRKRYNSVSIQSLWNVCLLKYCWLNLKPNELAEKTTFNRIFNSKALFKRSVKDFVRQAFFCFFDVPWKLFIVRWNFFTLKSLHKEAKIRSVCEIFCATCKQGLKSCLHVA